jgi:hypothetical protein
VVRLAIQKSYRNSFHAKCYDKPVRRVDLAL